MSKFYNNVERKEEDKAPPQQNRLPIANNANEDDEPMVPIVSASSHPWLALVHIGLKIATVAVYIVGSIVTKSFYIKQITIVLAAIDFWIVKNIVGRLLVGLRWWVDFDEQGEQKWKFECKVDENNVNGADKTVFWGTLVIFTLVWIVFTIINIVRLNLTDVIICLFCAILLGFNLFSYYRCSKVQSENLKKLAMQYGTEAVGQFMRGSIVANYF